MYPSFATTDFKLLSIPLLDPIESLETCIRIVIRLNGAVMVLVAADENPPAKIEGKVEYAEDTLLDWVASDWPATGTVTSASSSISETRNE
jgi:hypothetical protein